MQKKKFIRNRILAIIFVLVIIVLILVLTLILGDDKSKPYNINLEGGRAIDSKWLDEQKQIVISDDNIIRIYNSKNQIENETKINYTVNRIMIDYEKMIYLPTSNGVLVKVDDQLNVIKEYTLTGRVLDVEKMSNGNIAVVTGSGEYSPNYFIRILTPNGEEVFNYKTGFSTYELEIFDDLLVYATQDSKVVGIDKDKTEVFNITLKRPITNLIVTENNIVVTDEEGSIYLLNKKGDMIWQEKVSEYKLNTLGYIESENLISVSDMNNQLYFVNMNGEILHKQTIFETTIVSIGVYDDNVIYIMNEKGEGKLIDIEYVLNGQKLLLYKRIITVLIIIFILLSIIMLINAFERSKKKAKYVFKQIRKSKTAYMLILPSFLLLGIFGFYPAISALFYSLTKFNINDPIKFIGLENFMKVAEDELFLKGMGNMILLIITGIVKTLTIPLLVAELVFWIKREKIKMVFRTMYVIPSIVPGLVVILLWKMMYDPSVGLINTFLETIGLEQLKMAWLGNEKTALWAIIFAGFPWVGVFPFLVYFGGLINIDKNLYEAAQIDGIKKWSRFFRIDLPLIIPQIRILLFFAYIGAVQAFQHIFIFTNGGPGSETFVPALQMYKKISLEGDYGYASAIGVVLFTLAFIGTVLNMKLLKRKD